ncbi:MAG: hypothetical protein SFX18_00350 [Pirellulales bacterium]|nr:hypothetical protein [Pirellulales bacterium]
MRQRKARLCQISGPRATGDAAARHRAGLSLIEVVMASLLTGTLVAASLVNVGAGRRSATAVEQQIRASQLAADMLGEILQLGYFEPVDTLAFGREGAETLANRANYDDVDDYHNYNETTLQSKAGVSLTGWSGWTRHCTVQWVNPVNPTLASGTDQGLKLIQVTVRYAGRQLAIVRGLKTTATRPAWAYTTNSAVLEN